MARSETLSVRVGRIRSSEAVPDMATPCRAIGGETRLVARTWLLIAASVRLQASARHC